MRRAAIKPANWRENWKRHFPARRVSPRLVVKPPWRTFRLRPGDHVVEIDPGVSFGTGLHPTTRACLRLLDEYTGPPAGPLSFLDIGCGSGILAIAAARLGCRPLLALDHDPQAVSAARRNCAANKLERKIICRQADILNLHLPRKYDLIAANLLAGLLLTAAGRIIATVAPGGRLILSGILRRQYAAVRHGYRQLGFHEINRMDEGEWITGGFARR
ncbi:MAG: 50S ribosomal protein L11 methyltransferase [Lentisphaerae bacterium]|nr:50S ribosomal protein L11 methyltransferase [Lentisphaerota bacterium]